MAALQKYTPLKSKALSLGFFLNEKFFQLSNLLCISAISSKNKGRHSKNRQDVLASFLDQNQIRTVNFMDVERDNLAFRGKASICTNRNSDSIWIHHITLPMMGG